ncbi:retrovirus-related pol polyprotein from transposon TNT 1-94 [Tanacetum coccineum]
MQQPMLNPEDITDPTTAMNMALVLMAKAFKLNLTPTNNSQRISSNPRKRQIAQPGMNLGQDRQMQMVGGNGGNQFRQYAGQNIGYQNGYNALQNVRNQVVQNAVQHLGVQNGLIVVLGIANTNINQNENGNVVAARAEGNANGNNGNQIRCYNCRRLGHLAKNCTVRPRKRDASYLQTQLLIAQKEEARIQLQAEEFDLMAAADLDEIKEVNANCILMANLQSAEVHPSENCYNNDIFNMFTQEEHVEQSGGIVEQNPATTEETRALYDSLYNNISIEVEKVNTATVSSLQEEKKKLKSDFKSHEDELLDKQIQLENKIKELDNILADESLDKQKTLELEIMRLLRADVSQDIMSIMKNPTIVETSDLQTELDRKPSLPPLRNNFVIRQLNAFQSERSKFSKTRVPPKFVETNDLPNPVTSNLVPSPQESKVVKNDNVIAPGMFRIHPTRNPRKFLETVLFGNDHVAAILGDRDLQWGNVLITRVRNTCFVRNLEGVDLLEGNRTTNLYTINLHEMASASSICLMARATSTKSCKSKRASHPPKPVPNTKQRLHLLHMDLCGLMRVESINGKRYVLVIVDDYSRYTWIHFLRSKEEAPTRLLLRATLKTTPSFIVDSTKHHTSSLMAENQISPFYMNSGLSIIPRMIVKILGNLVQKVILASTLVILLLPVLIEFTIKGQRKSWRRSGLELTYAPSTITTQNPTEHELDLLFEAMYDDYISGLLSAATRTALATQAP